MEGIGDGESGVRDVREVIRSEIDEVSKEERELRGGEGEGKRRRGESVGRWGK